LAVHGDPLSLSLCLRRLRNTHNSEDYLICGLLGGPASTIATKYKCTILRYLFRILESAGTGMLPKSANLPHWARNEAGVIRGKILANVVN
jgi:hypothetical protein